MTRNETARSAIPKRFGILTELLIRLFVATFLALLFVVQSANAQAVRPVCDRTPQVRAAIVAAIDGVTDCNQISATHLATITSLNLGSKGITELKAGDFAGLSGLAGLNLGLNSLTTLPVGIFAGLSELGVLTLTNNNLASLPENIFAGLSTLRILHLDAGVIVTPSADAFVTIWRTKSADETITIPTEGVGYNYNVDCDANGIIDFRAQTDDTTCTYATAGTHTVVITGTFPRIYFNSIGDKAKIIAVNQWGTGRWTSMEQAFNGASNLQITATDKPDLSAVTSMNGMFQNAITPIPR